MKRLSYVAVAAVFILFIGCTPQQEPEDVPPPPQAPNQEPESAKKIIEDYGTGLVKSYDRSKTAQAKVDIREVQRAVQEYVTENEVFPGSLEDVKGYLSTDIDLTEFDYDPSSGTVTLARR